MRIRKLRQNSKSVADIPELKNEAHGWDPRIIGLWSKHRVPWKCTEGHIWEQVVKERVRQKIGCPVCANQKVLVGFNDLLTVHPSLAIEANGWDPSAVTFSSKQVREWKCSKGHIWRTSVSQRTRHKSNCPKCSHDNYPGRNYKHLPKLIETHPNLLDLVGKTILEKYSYASRRKISLPCPKGHNYQMTLRSLAKRGPYCTLCSGLILEKGVNDLETRFPNIAKEALGWDPSSVFINSQVPKKWKCPLGHTYETTVQTRVSGFIKQKGNGCPYCSNRKILSGFNDLKSFSREIAEDAHGWDPETVAPWTLKKYRWKCSFGHIYVMSPAARQQGHGCFTCNPGGFNSSKDGFLYLIQHSDWGLLQIGISNVPKQRIKQHEKTGWKLLDLFGPADGLLIREWENSIINYLRMRGINSPPISIAGDFVGITESWIEINFQVYTLRELMNKVKSLETY